MVYLNYARTRYNYDYCQMDHRLELVRTLRTETSSCIVAYRLYKLFEVELELVWDYDLAVVVLMETAVLVYCIHAFFATNLYS